MVNKIQMRPIKIKAKKLHTLVRKTKGLMFADKITPTYFETRYGIHTFFIKTAIDVVILDRNYTVYFIKEYLKPNRLLFWNPKYFRVLELPCGVIKKMGISVGKFITVTELN